jgi:hypothetical protein
MKPQGGCLSLSDNDADFTNFLEADPATFQYNIGETEQKIIDMFNDYRTYHPIDRYCFVIIR